MDKIISTQEKTGGCPMPAQNDFKASRYVFIVSSIGFVGLVVSLVLLSDFFDPIMNILKLMLGGMFGW